MTISSSLNAGIAGLAANASKLATISDNIANSSTFGYKRAGADFHSLVTGSGNGTYSAGGVSVTTQRMVDARGSLVSTSNATDLSISGRGMLPVTNRSGVESGDSAMMLTSTGSFRTDSNGYLTTSGGLVLMGVPADGDGVVPTFSRDTQAALQPIKIDRTKFVGEPTTSIQLGVNLPATDAVAGALGSAQELAVEYYDNLGNSENLIVTFTPTGPNEWEMAFSGPSPTTYTLVFDDSRSNGGALADIMDSSGASIATSFTGEIELTMDAGPISVNIGELGSGGGLSQLGGTFAPTSISKNGSPVGNMISIEVNEKGIVQGIFDTGTTRALYQVPIVDVPNPNGLKAGNQQTFSISQNSGSFYLWDAGAGPVGDVVSYAREESTTDVAAELTQLIQTQRAYSTNAKVIQTVDEMLQETTNIKR